MKKRIELGDTAKDSITGFSGVVIATTFWLHGCERLTLQPQKLDKDGKDSAKSVAGVFREWFETMER